MQDSWKIEVRKRLSGKLKGNLYKVYISPKGAKFYSRSKAIEQGFAADDAQDGRKKKNPVPKKRAQRLISDDHAGCELMICHRSYSRS